MINNKFDYSDKAHLGKWLAFGVCIEVRNPDKAVEISQFLYNQGYRFNSLLKEDNRKITLLLNPKLYDLFVELQIPVGECIARGSLFELVQQARDWMFNGNGEGLVCVSEDFQRKWKIGSESQPAVLSTLPGLLTRLEPFDLDPRVLQLCAVLTEVNKSKLIMGQLPQAKKKEKPNPSNSLLTQDALQDALNSALTKYDALESFFATDGMNQICGHLIDEVEHDLLVPELPQYEAKKEISAFIRNFVGKAYGRWKVANKQ
jgi:hypothetical protein